jgi:probable F420-dependent oxidoreductase
LALLSVALLDAGSPFAKLLLGGVGPWLLAGLLYLGAGLGLGVAELVHRSRAAVPVEAPLRRRDLPSASSRSAPPARPSPPGRRGLRLSIGENMPRNVAIGVGTMEFPFSGAAAYWRWVDLCEAGGIDSLWQTDRLVSPVPFLECMSVMAALAGRTRRIKFGVNVLSLAMRDAVLVARQCATIDFLSNGRLLPAFGIGSPLGPEWAALNLDPKTRGRKTDEGLEVIRQLWREDKVDFDGVHYRLSGASLAPKPVQPDLPMWIGGSSEAAIKRTARIGTGWQAGPETPAQAARVVAAIKAAAAVAGRVIDDDHYGAGIPYRFGAADDPALVPLFEAYRKRTGRDPKDYFAIGEADDIIARIAAYVDAGVSKFILRPAAKGDEEIMAQTRRLIEEVLPRVAARWPKPQKRRPAREAAE